MLNAAEPTPDQSVVIYAGQFIAGFTYTISYVGTTNFTAIGAASNTVGVTFVATGAGTGNGTATVVIWNFEVPNLEVLTFQDLNIVPIGYK